MPISSDILYLGVKTKLMNKKILTIISAFLVVAGGSVAVLLSSDSDNMKSETVENNQSVAINNIPATKTPGANAVKGTYQNYDEQKLAEATGTKVLFFHAPWCFQCRSIEKGIGPDTLPDNVSIFKVDYDSRQDLKKKYGVTLQTTFVVVDDQGNLVKKHVAYDEPTFDAVKKALF